MTLRSLAGYDRSRIAWWLVTIAVGATVIVVLSGFVGALVLGVFVYYATRPIYDRMEGRVRPPSLAAATALFLIALPVIVLVAYTVVVGIAELRVLAGAELDTYREILQPYVDVSSLTGDPQQLLTSVVYRPERLGAIGSPDAVRRALAVGGGYVQAFVSGLVNAFIALAVAFYLLRDDHKLAGWFRSAIGSGRTVDTYATVVDQDLQTIYFGNILNAFVVAVVAALSYNALDLVAPAGIGIPTPTLLGLLTGAASLIPVVGMKLVYVPIALYLLGAAVVAGGGLVWFPIAFLLVALIVVDGLTEVLLRPYISGRNLHVGLVLFAYILGPVFFGWYGLFLGPLLLVLAVHLARIVLPELVSGEPLTPEAIGRDPIPDAYGAATPEPDPTRPPGDSEDVGDESRDGNP